MKLPWKKFPKKSMVRKVSPTDSSVYIIHGTTQCHSPEDYNVNYDHKISNSLICTINPFKHKILKTDMNS
jgi:hypothetical protein